MGAERPRLICLRADRLSLLSFEDSYCPSSRRACDARSGGKVGARWGPSTDFCLLPSCIRKHSCGRQTPLEFYGLGALFRTRSAHRRFHVCRLTAGRAIEGDVLPRWYCPPVPPSDRWGGTRRPCRRRDPCRCSVGVAFEPERDARERKAAKLCPPNRVLQLDGVFRQAASTICPWKI